MRYASCPHSPQEASFSMWWRASGVPECFWKRQAGRWAIGLESCSDRAARKVLPPSSGSTRTAIFPLPSPQAHSASRAPSSFPVLWVHWALFRAGPVQNLIHRAGAVALKEGVAAHSRAPRDPALSDLAPRHDPAQGSGRRYPSRLSQLLRQTQGYRIPRGHRRVSDT